MYRKVMLSCIFGISMVAIVGTEAVAAVCALRSSGGGCLYWVGSVECNLNADKVGSLKDEPKLSCDVTPSQTENGALLCGNPGKQGHTAPGAQIVSVPPIASFGANTGIRKQDIRSGGVAEVTVIASPNLTALNVFCPNPNWVALDYAPCAASIDAKQSDKIGTIDTATFSCTLDCATLGYDPVTKKFERRQYDCTQQ